ncbi:hypothetical protein Ciccas_008622, partial [Cichlidogyrus casuarinus]
CAREGQISNFCAYIDKGTCICSKEIKIQFAKPKSRVIVPPHLRDKFKCPSPQLQRKLMVLPNVHKSNKVNAWHDR